MSNGWVKPGAEAAIVCTHPYRYTPVEIVKVGKRDVVCDDGSRWNINNLRKRAGAWDPSYVLVARDSDEAKKARAEVVKSNRINKVRNLAHAIDQAARGGRFDDLPDLCRSTPATSQCSPARMIHAAIGEHGGALRDGWWITTCERLFAALPGAVTS